MNGTKKTENATAAQLAHRLRLHYLDSPVERASICIFNQLGVEVEELSTALTLDGNIVDLKTDTTLHEEHTAAERIAYSVVNGRVLVDVRDAGDSWIRCVLEPGLSITLNGQVSRRFAIDTTSESPLTTLRERVVATDSRNQPQRQLTKRFANPADGLEIITYHKYRELICELCRQFYDAGWVTGTGGSISIRYGNRIYMTPSSVQKERIEPDELYLLDVSGEILDAPKQKPGRKLPKLSDCSPLFLHAYRLRNAGAVLHSHGFTCNLITSLCDGQSEFRISHQEMIKGLAGYGYHDELVIPIIDNTAHEADLADSLRVAIENYPQASAVLVRRHGIYVWGENWEAAKRHGECLHYLFEVAIEMHRLKLDYNVPPRHPREDGASYKRLRDNETFSTVNGHHKKLKNEKSLAEQHKYVVLDIEGTTTPITFVHDVLFPYAKDHVHKFLTDTWVTSATTQADVLALKMQANEDLANGLKAPNVLDEKQGASEVEVIQSLVEYVHWNIAADRKIGALKQLQGHIWDVGYESGELKSLVYDDVPVFLKRMQKAGVKVGIYSSGSRQAQKALFKYSNQGDLREYLNVYFDTKIGHKRETGSYLEMLQSLGVDSGKDVLFVTDVIEEAKAAAAAGVDTVLSVRPGNAPLPASIPFPTVRSFNEL